MPHSSSEGSPSQFPEFILIKRLPSHAQPRKPGLPECRKTLGGDRSRMNFYGDLSIVFHRKPVPDGIQNPDELLRGQGRRGSSAKIDRVNRDSAEPCVTRIQVEFMIQPFQERLNAVLPGHLHIKRAEPTTHPTKRDVHVNTQILHVNPTKSIFKISDCRHGPSPFSRKCNPESFGTQRQKPRPPRRSSTPAGPFLILAIRSRYNVRSLQNRLPRSTFLLIATHDIFHLERHT